jgi:DNA-binding CsgD family transcriptional regulator
VPASSERLDLFSRSFGLTVREHELLGLLATGSDTRAMARQMSLSEHTIQDHLKSIFAKTGARDRVTVLSRALGTRREASRSTENSSQKLPNEPEERPYFLDEQRGLLERGDLDPERGNLRSHVTTLSASTMPS